MCIMIGSLGIQKAICRETVEAIYLNYSLLCGLSEEAMSGV